MSTKRYLFDRHTLELVPLLFVLFILPFLNGGESPLAKIVFLALPLFYLPLLFSSERFVARPFSKIFALWVVFLLALFFSTVFSISLVLSVPRFFELLGVFLYFLFFYLVVGRLSDLRIFSFGLVAVGFVLTFISLVFIIFPPSSLHPMNLLYARYGHNHLSDYLLFVLPLVMVLFISSRRPSRTFTYGFLLVFFFVAFYLTFSRAAFVILSLMTLFLLLIYRPPFLKTVVLSFFGFFPLVLLLTFLLVSASPTAQQLALPSQAKGDWLWRQMLKPLNKESRPEYWRQATQGFLSRPLFGNGPGTFRLTSKRFQQDPIIYSWFVHNSFFESLTEVGLVGFFALFSLLLHVGFALRGVSRRSLFSFPLLFGVSGALFQSLLDYNFNFLAIFVLFWVILAMLLKLSPHSSRLRVSFPHWPIWLIAISCFGYAVSISLSLIFHSLGKRAEQKSFDQAFVFYKNSTLLPSVDVNRFQRFLGFANLHRLQSQVTPLEPSIIFWNREDSEIYRLLAESRSSPNEAFPLLSRMTSFTSPFEKARLMPLLLGLDSSDLSVTYFLDILVELNYVSKEEGRALAAGPYRGILTKYFSKYYDSAIASPLQIKRWVAKTFYFTGLELLEDGKVDEAERFWEWARQLSLDLDYFQIESAAFFFHIRNDEPAAKVILLACLEHPYPRKSCQNQLDMPLENLFVPGSYRMRVEELSVYE